ncbi:MULTISPECIES: winged helix DNA-binding domain-containing protein [unclassified Streptomyces]|uniref:winged helix DNA-binding domain-containing protein n=1 Tax=unclassified Streptomyces TaxID=2593676 RepID=UPI002258443F|nr:MULTISPECIES: winged helix DNA-binding domain-containing protein [unclassified Streptomyces]MCX5047667.1 winged helix DNA-binding domain-containing protein [Streptomyces sp. NBC_00474]MCX5057645.1 winged helix DNA-binding domain-containing protein [Streptomyces sp. NBC_00452]MCX5288720.1 winged helix DNA-binding domain-containing protein [Streptomyces sp. NBC_00183]
MGDGVRYIGAAERRARLALRQRLAPEARAGSPEEVAGSLVALHGTDPATVYLAVGARLADAATTVPETERALYTDRSLVRMHGMRHTVFVFPTDLTAVVHASTGLAVAARERTSLLKDMAKAGAPDAAWLKEVEESALAALTRRGQATAAELAQDEPRLREQFAYAAGKSYEGVHTVSTRLLRVLGVEGRVVRGRPLGSWTSSQFRWAVAPPHPELDVAEAQAALLGRWLTACGPATEDDLKWWTGWKVTDVRRALAAIGARSVALDEGTGYVVDGDVEPVAGPAQPWAALLPGLDPAAMGWRERDWYLAPELRPLLFDRSGNVGPTVWWDGRVVGGWAQRLDGEIVWRVLVPSGVGREAEAAIGAEVQRLQGWLGTTKVTPRFRTPVEKELAG